MGSTAFLCSAPTLWTDLKIAYRFCIQTYLWSWKKNSTQDVLRIVMLANIETVNIVFRTRCAAVSDPQRQERYGHQVGFMQQLLYLVLFLLQLSPQQLFLLLSFLQQAYTTPILLATDLISPHTTSSNQNDTCSRHELRSVTDRLTGPDHKE